LFEVLATSGKRLAGLEKERLTEFIADERWK